MGRIALGYGSEWHLLRYLGRHRQRLTNEIETKTGLEGIRWLDFGFSQTASRKDGFGDLELTGLDFLPVEHAARQHWRSYWPQTGNAQNWDAVGSGTAAGQAEWLLLEAKANLEEVNSSCQAKATGGLSLINKRLNETKAEVGADAANDWTRPYYQYANRLATLRFLLSQGILARLVFLYFTGDSRTDATCPTSTDEWLRKTADIKRHLGLKGASHMESRIHDIFLPVAGHHVAADATVLNDRIIEVTHEFR